MRTYNIQDVESDGYISTGKIIEAAIPSMGAVQRLAFMLDYKHSDIQLFRTGPDLWTAFIQPGAIKGYKSEAILP